MMHYLALVFTKKNGKSVDDLLYQFGEKIECGPYVEFTKEQAIAAIRTNIELYKNTNYARYLADPKAYEENPFDPKEIDYLKNIFPKRLNQTNGECYEEMKSLYNDDMISPNGDLLSKVDPMARFDWYCIDGSGNSFLHKSDGEGVSEAFVNEIDWTACTPYAFGSPDKNEIDWTACAPYAFISPDGEWHEISLVQDESDWENEFMAYINNLDADTMVTVVECHRTIIQTCKLRYFPEVANYSLAPFPPYSDN